MQKTLNSIAQLNVAQVKQERCQTPHCGNPATHIDTRTREHICQPHSFSINRDFRAELIHVRRGNALPKRNTKIRR